MECNIYCVAKLLNWLDGFDWTDKHENTYGQWQKTTGEWLFNSLPTGANIRQIETLQSSISWQEYLTSDTIAHRTFFVHPPCASLKLATVSIFSLILFGEKLKPVVDNGW